MSGTVLRLLASWAALLILLALTVGAAFLPIGGAKPWIALLIAAAKAAIILWFFMELRQDDGIGRLAGFAAFLWLAMLLLLSAADYVTRAGG